jgi:hypothetical protein
MEGLGHELLDLAGTGDSDLVVLGKLVHAENGNDILKILVILQSLLDLKSQKITRLGGERSELCSGTGNNSKY